MKPFGKDCEACSKQIVGITYGKIMYIIDDIRGVVRGDKRQVLEDLKDKLRKEFGNENG